MVTYAVQGVAPDLENVRRFLELCAKAIKQARTRSGWNDGGEPPSQHAEDADDGGGDDDDDDDDQDGSGR